MAKSNSDHFSITGPNKAGPDIFILLLFLLPIIIGCQGSAPKVSDGGGLWPGLLAENPVTRTQTIHMLQQSGDRSQAPLLFPFLNDRDRWVRYNARVAILILAGPHRENAPAYNYLSERSLLKKAPKEHRDWWEETFPGSTG
ncbi:MAG: hypothetical protein CBC13_07350 [Planctomycetia bacterium TMED53]|nr:MAG: hypothetical protein CBC13_07350 [Planctomycetia bacterium TMED53]